MEEALQLTASDPGLDLRLLAAHYRISSVRLRHLVQTHSGLTLRGHKLWHRTMQGVERLLSGASISSAAQQAGFAAQAHFTRSFSRFFGRSPSSIQGEVHVLEAYGGRAGRAS